MIQYTFNEEFHEYRVGSRIVPSCTQVLGEGGLVPQRFVSEEIFEHKGELGREVHKACHLHNMDALGEYDVRVKPYLRAWIKFKMESKFQLLSSEFQTVANLNGMDYGMKVDCNAYVDKEDTIIELKIGEVYPHHAIQTAGYAAGLPHPRFTSPMARFISRKRITVQLRSHGVPKVHRHEHKSDFETFASLLHIASWKRMHDATYENIAQLLKEKI